MTTYANFITEVFLDGDSQGYYAVPETFLDFDEHGDAHFDTVEVETTDADGEIETESTPPETPDDFVYLDLDDEDAYRMLALGLHLDDVEHATDYHVYDARVQDGRREYLVMTDTEADKAWEQSLENYLDECVLAEMSEMAQNYFDRERWMEDAKMDGRGHSLASYDGNENEVETGNGTYYIYRMN